MNYKLYKSYNLIHKVYDYKSKSVATRIFQTIRRYSSYKYSHLQYPNLQSVMFDIFNDEYHEDYDNLLLDIIYNAPLTELSKMRGFGKSGLYIINTIRKENKEWIIYWKLMNH